jgi:hypothetical protein
MVHLAEGRHFGGAGKNEPIQKISRISRVATLYRYRALRKGCPALMFSESVLQLCGPLPAPIENMSRNPTNRIHSRRSNQIHQVPYRLRRFASSAIALHVQFAPVFFDFLRRQDWTQVKDPDNSIQNFFRPSQQLILPHSICRIGIASAKVSPDGSCNCKIFYWFRQTCPK